MAPERINQQSETQEQIAFAQELNQTRHDAMKGLKDLKETAGGDINALVEQVEQIKNTPKLAMPPEGSVAMGNMAQFVIDAVESGQYNTQMGEYAVLLDEMHGGADQVYSIAATSPDGVTLKYSLNVTPSTTNPDQNVLTYGEHVTVILPNADGAAIQYEYENKGQGSFEAATEIDPATKNTINSAFAGFVLPFYGLVAIPEK